jgi:NAD(P)-dependent dehydrogenase (short-subunit alcohol dehydrogenase family)
MREDRVACKPVTASMQGRVCVITGSNTGIGKAAAEQIAALGAHVVMVCRNRGKAERAMADVTSAAIRGGRGGSVELRMGDLSSQAEVRRVAGEIAAAHPAIHVLVNNAGLALNRRELTVDGIERTFAVNYLAYFMLANLLLPALRAAGSARIVNVASHAHRGGRLEFGNLQGERRYRNVAMYAASKLEDVTFTFAIARRLAGSGVTANALHPGVVATEIWRQVPVMNVLSRLFMLSPEKGARTTVYLAASPDVEGVTGEYFDKCSIVQSAAIPHDERLQDELWARSVALTGVGGEV